MLIIAKTYLISNGSLLADDGIATI